PVMLVEVLAPEEHPLLRSFSLQVFLAAVRPVVGRLGFSRDHYDASAEAFLAQGLNRVFACGAAAEDDEGAGVGLLAPTYGCHAPIAGLGGYAHDDLVAIDTHLVDLQRIQARRLELIAGGGMEAGVVPGADDAVAAEHATGQRRAVV